MWFMGMWLLLKGSELTACELRRLTLELSGRQR